MKTIKKLWAVWFAVLITLCMVVGLAGCEKKSGPIPNGDYGLSNQGENVFEYTDNDIRNTYGWEIEGNEAKRWVSSCLDYKAKIVKKEGKIYFEGYKWKDLFSSREQGYETMYEVVYEEETQTITLTELKSEE